MGQKGWKVTRNVCFGTAAVLALLGLLLFAALDDGEVETDCEGPNAMCAVGAAAAGAVVVLMFLMVLAFGAFAIGLVAALVGVFAHHRSKRADGP